MLTGLFGVGGVLVGGGVTAWADRESDNRRTIIEGVSAARLVHLELYGLETKLNDAVADEGDWRWVSEPPLTPILEHYAPTLAPVLETDEWSKLATLVAQCRFTEPLLTAKRTLAIRKSDELAEEHPEWATATDIDDEDKEILGRITGRIQPALDALTPLINGDRGTRTQRVMRWLRLTPRTLGT